MYDLIIIGGGPAGITAGIYAARQKLSVLLITKNFGGQMARKAVNIENYPGFEEISGFDLIQKFESHLRKYKVEIEMDAVKTIKKQDDNFSVITEMTGKQFDSKAVIIASGSDPRPLEAEGEKEFIGRGVSYCTACDAPMFEGKAVAVIGGGNSGFEAALALTRWAKKVYILEYGPIVKAEQSLQDLVLKTGKAEIVTNAALKKILGEQFVDSIVFEDVKTKEEKKLAVEGVFVEIGYKPVTSFAKELTDFSDKDEIIINPKTGETRTPGLFAAGDADDVPFKQIIIACGEGAKAAIAAYNYLIKKT